MTGKRLPLEDMQQLLALEGQTVTVDTRRTITDPDGNPLYTEGEVETATLAIDLAALGWTLHDDDTWKDE